MRSLFVIMSNSARQTHPYAKLLLGGMMLIILFPMFVPPNIFAQTTNIENLRQNISGREEDIKQLEQEIAEYKIRIDAVGNQKKTLQSAVQTLDLSRAKLTKDIQLTQKKVERTKSIITGLNNDIGDKEDGVTKNKKVISHIIFQVNQADEVTLLEILLTDNTLSTFLQDIDELTKLQESLGDHIKSLKHLMEGLGTSKTSYQAQMQELTGLNTQLSDQKQLADNERAKQAQLLTTTKNQESNYKKILAEREARKRQFEQEISNFEARLHAAIDPRSFPLPGTKVFLSPVGNPFIITQKFGKSADAQRLYVSGTHNGTDFRASLGTPIKAPLGGVVTATGDTDKVCPGASYGRWVLIKHPNGLSTLYGHFELIKVQPGQELNTGDIIGYSGNTGYSTGPHLHVSLYVSSAVAVTDLPSKSCRGAVFHLPVAPMNAYLDFGAYL